MKTKSIMAAVVAVAMSSSAPLRAQNPQRITLDEALALFARNNLELRIARSEVAEATGLALQSGAVNNPVLSGSHEPLLRDGSTYAETYVTLSQRLEWPGTRSARREAANHRVAVMAARAATDSLRIALDVKRAFVEAAYSDNEVRTLRRIAVLFRDAEVHANERLADGDISRYDLGRVQLERTRYEGRLARAELEADVMRRALVTLVAPESADLDLAPAFALGETPPARDASSMLSLALERRPELLSADAAIEDANAQLVVFRGERIPDLTAIGGFKRQSDGFSGVHIGVSLPLPLWDRRSGAIDAARARVIMATSRFALTHRQIQNDVRAATAAYGSLRLRVAGLGNDGAVAGGDILAIAQVAYEEGEMELLDLLDAAAATLDAESLDARLRADLWIAYYQLDRAVGGFDSSTNDREGAQ